MKTEGTNLLVLTISAFWNSSRWPLANRWDPEGREVSHKVVVIDRFHYIIFTCPGLNLTGPVQFLVTKGDH